MAEAAPRTKAQEPDPFVTAVTTQDVVILLEPCYSNATWPGPDVEGKPGDTIS